MSFIKIRDKISIDKVSSVINILVHCKSSISIALLWKPIRAIRFSDKHDPRFQDRAFDVELLLEV